jgi:hypothetical protein
MISWATATLSCGAHGSEPPVQAEGASDGSRKVIKCGIRSSGL